MCRLAMQCGLVCRSWTKPIAAVAVAEKTLGYVGVAERLVGLIEEQVLLGDVGEVGRFCVFRIEMVVGLVFPRSDLFRNGKPPLFCVGELRVDIKDQPAKGIKAVADDLPDRKFRVFDVAHDLNVWQAKRSRKSIPITMDPDYIAPY